MCDNVPMLSIETRGIPFKSPLAWRWIVAILFICLGAGFVGGYICASYYPTSLGYEHTVPAGVDFDPVWKAWHEIDEKFVPAAVASTTPVASTTAEANQRRVWGMIAGMADSLGDPYTFFMPPVESKQFSDDMSGAFEGVGMEVAIKNNQLVVVSPLKGTPSEQAGIRAGDAILSIDGTNTHGMDVTSAVKRIRGPKDTIVTLKILREGWDKARDIKVTRDIINIPIVTTTARKDGVFVIRIQSFTANSGELFRGALREFIASGDTRLILDLRGNPGGYLDAAVQIASWFLPLGKIVVTEDYAGHEANVVHRSFGYDVFNDNLRMVILVDRGSASASEILSEALRYWNKATLVGTNTFGKGCVQELVPITSDTSLKITVARWLGPDGTHIPLEGIKPDTEVLVPDTLKKGEDPQMDKAVSILLTQKH